MQQKLWTVTLLWAYGDHLPAGDRIPTPPWFPKIGDYVRPASRQGENSTAPIHPATMSPLLVWALRFVTDYADDILAGFDEAQRLYTSIPLSPTPGGQRRLRRYAAQLAAAGRGWPRDSYSKDRSVDFQHLHRRHRRRQSPRRRNVPALAPPRPAHR